MSVIWDLMQNCAESLKERMLADGELSNDETVKKYSWDNHVYISNKYRRGHVEVVDQREKYGLFILHATVFPFTDSDAPIWGFDAVCGKNKITGAFHDFSLVSADHSMYNWFKERTSNLEWKKQRDLPPWAQAIFSPSMVAAGNLNSEEEVKQFVDLGIETLDYYINNLDLHRSSKNDYTDAQNRYCMYQKQNPHVVKSMVAMGYEQAIIESFVQEVLFPEIK